MDLLLELGLPGLVFIGLSVWLVRRAFKAARTEEELEAGRLEGALAEELKAARARAVKVQENQHEVANENEHANEHQHELVLVSAHGNKDDPAHDPLSGADLTGANPAHLPLISALVAEREAQARSRHTGPTDVPRRVEVLWVRSTATHCAWCERRHAATLAARAMTRDVICVAQIERGEVIDRWSFG